MAATQKTATKMERVGMRVDIEQKQRIKLAAYLRGLSVSAFIAQSAEAAAVEILERDTLVLRGEDAVAFVEMLENPPEPGPNLRAAFKRYNEEKRLREDAK